MTKPAAYALIMGFAVLGAACGEELPDYAPEGVTVECAIGAGVQLEAACTAEQVLKGNRVEIVIHHPDGGFRRFEVLPDGAGVAVADGAEILSQEMKGPVLEVVMDNARYLIPVDQGGESAGE